jgi:hypothetical protein
MIIDCLVHTHSSVSYDGESDLAEVARVARDRGFSCMLMSEHNNTLDDAQVKAFAARCRDLSDDTLLIIPGLELSYDQNRVHLLAYGIDEFIESMSGASTFRELVHAIHERGGVAVLAHPTYKRAIDRLTFEDLTELDGIEIWNTRNGNRFCPNAEELRALRRLQEVRPRMAGFGGVDLHYVSKFPRLVTRLDVQALTCNDVLNSLRAGAFSVNGEYVSVDGHGERRAPRLWAYSVMAHGMVRSRRFAYRLQGWLEKKGFQSPRVLVQVGRSLF